GKSGRYEPVFRGLFELYWRLSGFDRTGVDQSGDGESVSFGFSAGDDPRHGGGAAEVAGLFGDSGIVRGDRRLDGRDAGVAMGDRVSGVCEADFADGDDFATRSAGDRVQRGWAAGDHAGSGMARRDLRSARGAAGRVGDRADDGAYHLFVGQGDG